jgi:hypothetical protein
MGDAMLTKKLVHIGFIGAAISLSTLGSAHATLIATASGTVAGNTVTAEADFTIVGDQLTIVLTNTSPANGLEAPASTLTGLVFGFQNLRLGLTPVSATSPNAIFDSAACDANPCGGANVNIGGEWGLDNGTGLTSSNMIGSAGYVTTGLAGNLGNFNGLNLQNPTSLDGINFGIISNTAGPLNGGLSGVALVQDTATFVLTGVSGFTESDIDNISFLYGTTPEGRIPGVCLLDCGGITGNIPEPATVTLFGVGLIALAAAKRRKII